MAHRHISQREARQLQKRVNELESAIARERRTYGQEWLNGVNIATVEMNPTAASAVRTARRLGHACVLIGDDSANVRIIALPHPKVAGL